MAKKSGYEKRIREMLTPVGREAAAGIGRYTDVAMGETRRKQLESEGLLQGQVGALSQDPLWKTTRAMALSRAQTPGMDPTVLARARGRISARGAASAASGKRSAIAQLARRGISGPAAVNAMQLAGNRAKIAAQGQLLDLDVSAEQARSADEAAAINQLKNVLTTEEGARSSAVRALAATKRSYDPLGDLGKVQRLAAPVGALTRAEALRPTAPVPSGVPSPSGVAVPSAIKPAESAVSRLGAKKPSGTGRGFIDMGDKGRYVVAPGGMVPDPDFKKKMMIMGGQIPTRAESEAAMRKARLKGLL